MSVTPESERAAGRAHRRGHERLARPDPPQPDRERRARSGWSTRTRCAASPPTRRSSRRRSSAPTTTTTSCASWPREGTSAPRASTSAIAIKDVQDAADVLRPRLRRDRRLRRLRLARGRARPRPRHRRTLAQAREYWERVDRPNVMIKIPGTDEGVPAIEQAIYEGINVNVTLLFAVEAYAKVAEAYIRGLERRHAAGESLDVHSVASFFVSRVDTEVDKRLEAARPHRPRRARPAIANARAAYVTLQGDLPRRALRRAARGRRAGAAAAVGVDRRQEPAYRDTMYVDGWSAPDTVNTMPMATLLAAAERGEITGATADVDPEDDAAARRARRGRHRHRRRHRRSCCATASRRSRSRWTSCSPASRRSARRSSPGARPTIESLIPDELEPADRRARRRRPPSEDVARRIWRKDETLWGGPGVPEIGNRLGWLTIADAMLEEASTTCVAFARRVRWPTGSPTPCCSAWAARRSRPRCCGARFGDQPSGARRCTCSTRPTPARSAPCGQRSTSSTRCSSSRRSRAGRSRRCRCSRYFHERRAATAATSSRSPTRAARSSELAQDHGFRAQFDERPEHRRALLGAVVLRARARRR